MSQSDSKILCLSDLHLTDNPAEEYRHEFMRDLPALVERRKPQAVAILGDLTEEKDRHSARLVNNIVDELDALAAIVPVLILMGNHDYRNEGHPFFAFVKRLRNIAWVDKVCMAGDLPKEFRSIFGGCLFLPHTRDYERDWADLINAHSNMLRFRDYRFIFAHNTFDGSKTPAGHLLDGIPVGIFGKNAKVISGDVHTPQVIGPVTYVGAPYTVDFGDEYAPRLIEIKGHAFSSVSVRAWPQKRLIVLPDLSEFAAYCAQAGVKQGDIVKVRLEVDDMGRWGADHAAILKLCEDRGLRLFRAEPILSNKIIRRQHRVRPEDQADDKTLLKQYAKRHDIDPKTLAEGLEFLK